MKKATGICPVCNGTKRKPAGNQKWVTILYGYDAETHTLPCTNCGGQYQSLTPTGIVPLDDAGTPCTHHYETSKPHQVRGRCFTHYCCKHCNDEYVIDSSD